LAGGEDLMTRKAINLAQDYLTVMQSNGDRVFQIVNIEFLLRRHPPEDVITFLQRLHKDFGKKLKRALMKNKCDPWVNDIVARRFRIKMAINTIKNNLKKEASVA
jgi:hypothetical protein